MKRRFSLILVCVLIFALVSACSQQGEPLSDPGQGSPQEEGPGKLVIYTPNTEEILQLIVPMFEKDTGIQVEITAAGTGELAKRIQSEKDNPVADVFWGITYATLANNIELYEDYTSKYDSELPEEYRAKDGINFFVLNPPCLLVNNNLIGDIKVESWDDLLNPALKGKITTADPVASSSAYVALESMLIAKGGSLTADAGWDYVKALMENMEGKMASSSGSCHKSVADGEYTVAITYEDPSMSYLHSGAPVTVVFPKEGVTFPESTSAILKGAKNMDNAKKFIDFLASKEAQQAIGMNLNVRPIRSDVKINDAFVPFETITVLPNPPEESERAKAELVERFTDIITSIS